MESQGRSGLLLSYPTIYNITSIILFLLLLLILILILISTLSTQYTTTTTNNNNNNNNNNKNITTYQVPVGAIRQGTRRQRLTAYYSCSQDAPGAVYVHPQSSLYNTDPTAPQPEYVIYDALISNEKGDRTYMSNVTIINGAWITPVLGQGGDSPSSSSSPSSRSRALCPPCPLLKLSPPLEQPQPFYDAEKDSVNCWVRTYAIDKYAINR